MSEDAPERPPRDEWISLQKAAQLFDPPKSRKAMDQLFRRGVLTAWEEGGRLYTTEALVREYAFNSPRASRLIDQATGTPIEYRSESKEQALEKLVSDLSAENTALRLRIIELEHEGR